VNLKEASMAKLTVLEKNKTGSKKESSFNATTIDKPDLIEMGIVVTEKREDNSSTIVSLPDEISAQKKFDEYLIEAIDNALTSLGAPVKNTVYLQLEVSFNMTKNEIPKQIDEFVDIIHRIFGLGASRLEIKFMKNLHSKIKINIGKNECDWPLSKWIVDEISFKDYVHNARENYCNL
jgi:hypothetical protein